MLSQLEALLLPYSAFAEARDISLLSKVMRQRRQAIPADAFNGRSSDGGGPWQFGLAGNERSSTEPSARRLPGQRFPRG